MFDRKLRTTFDGVSELYDASRPHYPTALLDDLVMHSGINGSSLLLEIGCGSGIATIPLAKQGYHILAIDISQNLIDIAKRKSNGLNNIRFNRVAFENLETDERFDLVYAAQSIHWVDPANVMERITGLLKPGGRIAFYATFMDFSKEPFIGLWNLFQDQLPHMPDHGSMLYEEKLFSGTDIPARTTSYPYQIPYTQDRFIDYLRTISWINTLPVERQNRIYTHAREIFKDGALPFNARMVLS